MFFCTGLTTEKQGWSIHRTNHPKLEDSNRRVSYNC